MRAESTFDDSLSVGIIESHALLRDGLRSLVEAVPGMRCVAAWGDYGAAALAIPETKPAALILSISPPLDAGLHFLESLGSISMETRTIVLLDCEQFGCPIVANPKSAGRAASGSSSVIPPTCKSVAARLKPFIVVHKDIPFPALREVIWRSASRRRSLAADSEHPADLTARERQVVYLITLGHSNEEIARELGLSYSTTKNYVSSILSKLNLKHRTQIALHALRFPAE